MRLTLAISAILLISLASEPRTVWGQQNRSMGQSGGMFSRSTGSGMSGGMGNSFGNSFGSSTGMGGQPDIGGGFMNSSGGMGGGQSGGLTRQAGDFIGTSPTQLNGRGFVGAEQAASGGAGMGQGGMGQGGMGQGGMGMGGMGQGMQGLGNPGMRGLGGSMMPNNSGQFPNGQGGMGGNGRGTRPIRTTFSVGFDRPAAASQHFSSSLARRLADLPALHWRSPGQVEIRGRTAILRGVVATEHDRDLAERVVRLEAAVDQVQNQLVVATNSSTPTNPLKSPDAAPGSPTTSDSAH